MSGEIDSFQQDAEKITDNMAHIKQREGASHTHLTGILHTMLDVSAGVRKSAFLMTELSESPDATNAIHHLRGIVDLAHESQDLSDGLADQDINTSLGNITETSETIRGEAEGILNGLSGEVAQTLTSMADLLDQLVNNMTATLQSSGELRNLATATEVRLNDHQANV